MIKRTSIVILPGLFLCFSVLFFWNSRLGAEDDCAKQKRKLVKGLVYQIDLETSMYKELHKIDKKFAIDYYDVALMSLYEVTLPLLPANEKQSEEPLKKLRKLFKSHMLLTGGYGASESWFAIDQKLNKNTASTGSVNKNGQTKRQGKQNPESP